MKDLNFVGRMHLELRDLDRKTSKLESFIRGSVFPVLSEKERELIHDQLDTMRVYA